MTGRRARPPCHPDHEQRRRQLEDAHGRPVLAGAGDALRLLGLRDRVHPLDVIAFVYRDQAAADAWAASNADHYGHPCLGTIPVDGGVLGVLDLRPALAREGVGPKDPAEPDLPLPKARPPGPRLPTAPGGRPADQPLRDSRNAYPITHIRIPGGSAHVTQAQAQLQLGGPL